MRFAPLVLVLALAGCAHVSDSERVASNACKVYPLEPTRSAARVGQVSELERQHAISALATSDLRHNLLNRPGGHVGAVENALRNCY